MKSQIKKIINSKMSYSSYVTARGFIYALSKNHIKEHRVEIKGTENNSEYYFSAKSLKEFNQQLSDTDKSNIQKELFNIQEKAQQGQNYYTGKCTNCDRTVDFKISNIPDGRISGCINWRETLQCPICGFNNRNRKIIEIVNENVKKDSSIYITEFITSLFRRLKYLYPDIVGSEYIADNIPSGSKVGGVLHEDLMQLSFKDKSFDFVLSFDVLEHVIDYKKALQEITRVLKDDGTAIFTVPFRYDQNEDEVRAVMKDGQIEYLMEPEYHGNPMSSKGSLVYTIPGWDLIDYAKSIGLEITAFFYTSFITGNFAYGSGVPQVLFIGKKIGRANTF